MNLQCSRKEIFLIAFAVVIGFLLRSSHRDRLAIEHFDEAIYSSGIWYGADTGEVYPMRHLYAPPMLPWMIKAADMVPGLRSEAPFWPAIILGTLTILAVWLVARSWFGVAAGLFAAFVVACSDFHVMYSRMALTDVPVLFWTISAVGMAARALHHQSARGMAVAGLLTGMAWWTKYTGWLPLAIVLSGSGFWWLVGGQKRMPALRLVKLMACMVCVAFAVWLPWLISLQADGGYRLVQDNHEGYYRGFSGWQDRMARHLVFHFHFDSWLGAVTIGIGFIAAGLRRWAALRLPSPGEALDTHYPSTALLRRIIGAAILLGFAASGVGSIGLLGCIAIGGLAGMFLWPVQDELFQRRSAGVFDPPCEGARSYCLPDLQAAPAIDPRIGMSFTLAWLCGMLLSTPLYHPYPRLSLPLVAAIWMAAAGGVSWWLEAALNAERRREDASESKLAPVHLAIRALVVASLVLTVLGGFGFQAPAVWEHRTSLRDATLEMAEAVLLDVDGKYETAELPLHADEHGILHPDPIDDAGSEDAFSSPSPFSRVARPFRGELPLTDLQDPKCVVYAFAEPAVLAHLRLAGIVAAPVQDLNISPATLGGVALPTYLVIGPYGLQQQEVFDGWGRFQSRFDHVADFHFAPGLVLLYNLFAPKWVGQHPESMVQTLELYRAR